MSVRKNRIPLQGISNLNGTWKSDRKSHYRTLSEAKQLLSNNQIKIKESKSKPNLQIFTNRSFLQNNVKMKLKPTYENKSAIQEIRKKYMRKDNVKKIIKSWKLDQKGFITQAEFKENLIENLKLNIPEQQISELYQVITEGGNKFGTKQFLQMIYQKPESSYFQKKLYNSNESSKARIMKIDDLVDRLEYNLVLSDLQKGSKKKNSTNLIMKQNQDSQSTQERLLNNESKLPESRSNNIRRHSRNELNQTSQQFFKTEGNFFSKKRFFQRSITNTTTNFNKTRDLNPKSMLGINQSKSRFGATPFVIPNVATTDKINKISLTQEVAQQQNKAKAYKLNKIAKMIEYREKEKENIQNIDNKLAERDSKNLIRKKYEQQAYQYATYIQNKWN